MPENQTAWNTDNQGVKYSPRLVGELKLSGEDMWQGSRRCRRGRAGWMGNLRLKASCKLLWGCHSRRNSQSHTGVCWKVGLEPSKQAVLFPLWPLPHRQHRNTAKKVAWPGWIPKAPPPYNITSTPRQINMAQNERTHQNSRKRPKRQGDSQPIWCRVQNW